MVAFWARREWVVLNGVCYEHCSLRTLYARAGAKVKRDRGPAAEPGGPPHMKASSRPRSTRDRPAKAPLSEEAIVDAALAILRAEGLEAVSMRRVAAALDTGAGSLYVYVAGRDGLLEAMFDRIVAAVKLETPDP